MTFGQFVIAETSICFLIVVVLSYLAGMSYDFYGIMVVVTATGLLIILLNLIGTAVTIATGGWAPWKDE